MNSLFTSSFTKLTAVTRAFIPSVSQVRWCDKAKKQKLRVNHRRLTKYITQEKRQQDKEIEDSFLPPPQKIEFDLQTLETRGFLRSTKPYTPPNDVHDRILNIARNSIGREDKNELMQFALTDPNTRFDFLSRCVVELCHDIPNSQLHKMTTVSAVIDYYQLPVSTVNTYDRMCDNPESLPPNLHMQKEPLRFNPDTDTMFGGISAYPERSTIVTGLKAKKKYKGFDARPVTSKLY